ncbi:Rrf2 family transcriptional regulator [Lachnospiraceae bacterium ZAX-1]
MKLSKKGRYGMRALIDLAIYSADEYMPLNVIAERNQIPLKYLEQVFASLRRAGIVKSLKGLQGGYLLGDLPQNISVSSILSSIDGNYLLEDEAATSQNESQFAQLAIQKLVIENVNSGVEEVLKHTTLEDLVQLFRQYQKQNMYYI